MKPEIEAAFIDINKDDIRNKLKSLNGKLIQPEILMKRVIYDIPGNAFARVRDEGNRIVMTYKRIDDLSLSGTKEINLTVDNYDKALDFMQAIGVQAKAVQETLREEWELDDVEICIDTWPWLPPYIEIEGPSEESVKAVATKLGFKMKDAHYGSVDGIYKIYYDVTSDDINYCPEIKFTDPPKWLRPKRKSQ